MIITRQALESTLSPSTPRGPLDAPPPPIGTTVDASPPIYTSNIFLTPHAHSEANHPYVTASSSSEQRAQPAASSANPQTQPFLIQLPSKPSSHCSWGAKPLASQPCLQPHRAPSEPPYPKPELPINTCSIDIPLCPPPPPSSMP